MLEIWPSLLPVPPLTILNKSEVPRSVNAGNVIRVESRAKVCVATKLYETARARSRPYQPGTTSPGRNQANASKHKLSGI